MYWYNKFLEEKTERKKLVAIYNAIGSLPFGFDNIEKEFINESAVDYKLIVDMKKRVKRTFQNEEDDSGNLYEITAPFTDEQLEHLARLYLKKRSEYNL